MQTFGEGGPDFRAWLYVIVDMACSMWNVGSGTMTWVSVSMEPVLGMYHSVN
jgi:hypothetical protein